MTVERPAVLGVVFGVAIGAIYIVWQRWDLRQKSQTMTGRGPKALVPGAVARLVFLGVGWWLVFQFTEADKYWLTGALLVTYTAPLLSQLKQMIFPK